MPDSCRIGWRADRAGGEDDLARCADAAFLAVLAQHQAGGALAVEQQAHDLGMRLDLQVAAAEHGPQEALGGVPAHAGLLVDVEVAAALVVAVVEVVDLGNAGLGGRVAEGVEDLPADARLLDAPFAAARVHLVEGTRLEGVRLQRPLVLVLLEVGQHVVPGPAGIAHLAPQVVVARLAAHVDHAVDRGAAAQHLAARIVEAAAVEARLRRGLEAPVGARIAHQVEVADGDVDPVVVVLAAGFQQQHARLGIGGQAVGQQAPGRAGADDDVVVGFCRHGRRFLAHHRFYFVDAPSQNRPSRCACATCARRRGRTQYADWTKGDLAGEQLAGVRQVALADSGVLYRRGGGIRPPRCHVAVDHVRRCAGRSGAAAYRGGTPRPRRRGGAAASDARVVSACARLHCRALRGLSVGARAGHGARADGGELLRLGAAVDPAGVCACRCGGDQRAVPA